ncbi:uncharacterized protein [Miscanthus floridulus]|uniref:uncharacterized protein n=1 Tax=Miscanthus floridulus TaxID=154761 RepID=UPI003459330E
MIDYDESTRKCRCKCYNSQPKVLDELKKKQHFIHEGIGCSEDYVAEVARARYEEKKLDERRKRAGRTVESPIVLFDEGNEDEDDTNRLSELIALAEAGLQADEAEDDTGRLSEFIALAEAGLQTEEAEDDTDRLSELIALAEAGLQVEEDDEAFFTQTVETADEVEAAYYRRKAY